MLVYLPLQVINHKFQPLPCYISPCFSLISRFFQFISIISNHITFTPPSSAPKTPHAPPVPETAQYQT